MVKKEEKTTIKINKKLASKAKKILKKYGFTNLSEFVEFLIEREVKSTKSNVDEEKLIKERLRALGYF